MSLVHLTRRDRAPFEVPLPVGTVEGAVALLRARKQALRQDLWRVRVKDDGRVRMVPVSGSGSWVPPFVRGRLVVGPGGVHLRGQVVESAYTMWVTWSAALLSAFFVFAGVVVVGDDRRGALLCFAIAGLFGWGLSKLITVASVVGTYVDEAERALLSAVGEQAVEG